MQLKNNLNEYRFDAEPNAEEKAPHSKGNASMECTVSAGMIGRLPNYTGKLDSNGLAVKHNKISNCNRYLSFQEGRIDKALKERNFAKAVLIWLMLLKISKSYQLVLFNRCCKGWYWRFSAKEAEEILLKAMCKIRSWDMTLLINRFYIQKTNGKWRPIGAPNFESRMISKALVDLVYSIIENDRDPDQHAYVRKKGTWSAAYKIIQLLREGYSGYEFDLKSFFNTVEPFIIHKKLGEYNKEITKLISNVIKDVEYRWDTLKRESELHWEKQENIIDRTGLPQGLSLSPVLCTWALEHYCRPKNLVMYADDGIYFYRNNITAFTDWMEKMGKAGVQLAPEKSGGLPDIFKFAGFTFDCNEKTVSSKDETISWRDPSLIEWLKKANNEVYQKDNMWKWEVHKDALITHRKSKMSIPELLKTLGKGIWKGEMYKGFKWIPSINRIIHIYTASTWSTLEILKTLEYKKRVLANIQPFKFPIGTSAFDFSYVIKGTYKNYLPEWYREKSKEKRITKKYLERQEFYNIRRAKMKLLCR